MNILLGKINLKYNLVTSLFCFIVTKDNFEIL